MYRWYYLAFFCAALVAMGADTGSRRTESVQVDGISTVTTISPADCCTDPPPGDGDS